MDDIEKLRMSDLFEGRLYVNIFEKEREEVEEVITESDLKLFFRCAYSYFIKKHIAPSKIPKLASSAQSLMFRQARKSLFNLRNPITGRLFPYQTRAGPEWKMAEEMTPEELRLYLANSSAEAFGGAIKGKWLYFIGNERYAGSPLVMTFANQDKVAANQLKVAAQNYYDFVIANGAPILGFINDTETFRFDGTLFSVLLPEVRKGLIIDDPTIWGFNADEKFDRTRNDIYTSSLVTLRILALCSLMKDETGPFVHRHFVRKLGLDPDAFDRWMDSGAKILPGIRYRHLEAGKSVVSETKRDDSYLDRLRRAFEWFRDRTDKELFIPNHNSCGFCPYNVLDMNNDVVCRKVKKGAKPAVHAYFFKTRGYSLESSLDTAVEGDRFVVTGSMAKSIDIIKQVNRLSITLRERDGMIKAVSTYESGTHGLGLEELILEKADAELQRVADERRMTVVHTVDFDRYFKFAGQKGVELKLVQLGYAGWVKTYEPRQS